MQLLPSDDDDRKVQIVLEESTSSNEIVAAERGDRILEEGEVSGIAESDDDDDDETRHLVAGDQPQCRICLDVGGVDLIGPCNCKGTQKYVHRSCLDNCLIGAPPRKVLHFRIVQSVEPSSNSEPMCLLIDGG